MKNKKTKKHLILKVLLALLVVAIVVGRVFSHFGGFGTGRCADTAMKRVGSISQRFQTISHSSSQLQVTLGWFGGRKLLSDHGCPADGVSHLDFAYGTL